MECAGQEMPSTTVVPLPQGEVSTVESETKFIDRSTPNSEYALLVSNHSRTVKIVFDTGAESGMLNICKRYSAGS